MKQLELFKDLPTSDKQYQRIHFNLSIDVYNKVYSYLTNTKKTMATFIRELIEKEMEK